MSYPTETEFNTLSFQALQMLERTWRMILRAAIWPYVLAFIIVYTGRTVGPPICYVISPWHAFAVVAFITSVVRIVTGVSGRSALGLAVPHPKWPGWMAFWWMIVDAALLMVPTAFVLFLMGYFFAPFVVTVDSLALKVASLLVAVFILNTLLGLVIGVGIAQSTQDQQRRS